MTTPQRYVPRPGPLDVVRLVDQLIAQEGKLWLDPLTRKADQLHAALAACETLQAALRRYRHALGALARACRTSPRTPPRVQRHRANACRYLLNSLIRNLAGPSLWSSLHQGGVMPRHPLAGDPLSALLLAEARHARQNPPIQPMQPMQPTQPARRAPRPAPFAQDWRAPAQRMRLHRLAPAPVRQIGSLARLLALLDLALSANGRLPRQIGALHERLAAVTQAHADQHASLCRLRERYIEQFDRLNQRLASIAPPAA